MSEIRAKYRIETSMPVEQATAIMAGEQSSGTFVKIPGETPELQQRHGAKIVAITLLEQVDTPSLPGAKSGDTYQRAEVELSFPLDNVGTNLSVAFTTVAGNLFELSPFSGLKLLDVTFPPEFAQVYQGPAFGIAGTRKLTNVYDRPIIGTIIKPSVGLSPEQTATLAHTLAEAGLDFIKDDELQANSPHSPFGARVKAVMDVVNRHADRTGKKVMVAFNITDDLDQMLRHHEVVLEHGGTCVMVNMIAVGLPAISHLRRHCQLPIHGHRAGWGMYNRHPMIGMEYSAFQKFYRLAGVDHLHVNGIRNKFCETDESVIASAKACLTPMPGIGYEVLPVFSSGQWAGQAPDTYRALGSTDCMYVAGGGIMAHPDGIAAGVRSLHEAWQAALEHIPLATYAETHTALKHSLQKYGGVV